MLHVCMVIGAVRLQYMLAIFRLIAVQGGERTNHSSYKGQRSGSANDSQTNSSSTSTNTSFNYANALASHNLSLLPVVGHNRSHSIEDSATIQAMKSYHANSTYNNNTLTNNPNTTTMNTNATSSAGTSAAHPPSIPPRPPPISRSNDVTLLQPELNKSSTVSTQPSSVSSNRQDVSIVGSPNIKTTSVYTCNTTPYPTSANHVNQIQSQQRLQPNQQHSQQYNNNKISNQTSSSSLDGMVSPSKLSSNVPKTVHQVSSQSNPPTTKSKTSSQHAPNSVHTTTAQPEVDGRNAPEFSPRRPSYKITSQFKFQVCDDIAVQSVFSRKLC